MQTIKSFFAPAPYGTPWTTDQIEQIQINQKTGKKIIEPEKTKLDRKRYARSFAIQVLKIHFGNSAFLNRDAARVLDGVYFSKTSILISYMVANNIVVKVGKPIHQDGYFYRFVNAT